MSKCKLSIIKYLVIALIVLVGSYVTYYAMNLFWADVANAAMGFNFPLTLATLPCLMIALVFVLGAIFLVRFDNYEAKFRKHLIKRYSIIGLAFSGVGLVTAIVAALVVYKSIMAPVPFPGAFIVYIAVHVLAITALVLILMRNKITDADEKVKITHKYRIYTAAIALFTFIAFDRCGAALASPAYIEWSRLDLTWFFYLSLFLPLAVLVVLTLYKTGHLNKDNVKGRLIAWGVVTGCAVILCAAVAITGMNEPLLVSLVSPAMPVERLATFPVDFIFLYVPAVVISAVELVLSIVKATKKQK